MKKKREEFNEAEQQRGQDTPSSSFEGRPRHGKQIKGSFSNLLLFFFSFGLSLRVDKARPAFLYIFKSTI